MLLLSALFFGLPHGGYDFWILFDSTRRHSRSFYRLSWLLVFYLMLSLVVIGVWYFLPSVILLLFLALTAWHFGSGDAVWFAENKSNWLLHSFGRGLLVIFAPLTFYPNESSAVLTKLDTNSTSLLISLAPYALPGGLLIALAAYIQNLKFNNQHRISSFLETLILLFFFWLTTPLLAITVYFIGVHSWRHLLRLKIYEQDDRAFENSSWWQIIRKFHLRSLPLTLISLTGLGFIFWLLDLKINDIANYTSAYLVLLSALTFPHAVLIAWKELSRSRLA